jgi:hypothetical protein
LERPAKTLGADGKHRPSRVAREVKAEIIEEAPPGQAPRPTLAR